MASFILFFMVSSLTSTISWTTTWLSSLKLSQQLRNEFIYNWIFYRFSVSHLSLSIFSIFMTSSFSYIRSSFISSTSISAIYVKGIVSKFLQNFSYFDFKLNSSFFEIGNNSLPVVFWKDKIKLYTYYLFGIVFLSDFNTRESLFLSFRLFDSLLCYN